MCVCTPERPCQPGPAPACAAEPERQDKLKCGKHAPTRTCAARYCLVVAHVRVTECQVVHAALPCQKCMVCSGLSRVRSAVTADAYLGGRCCGECTQNNVSDALAREDVPAHHSSLCRRAQQAAIRDEDCDRLHAALRRSKKDTSRNTTQKIYPKRTGSALGACSLHKSRSMHAPSTASLTWEASREAPGSMGSPGGPCSATSR